MVRPEEVDQLALQVCEQTVYAKEKMPSAY
jgi:hypothetical protein